MSTIVCTEICLGRRLVQLGRLQSVQPVDGELEQLGRGFFRCECDELRVLLLPDLRGFGNTGNKLTNKPPHDLDPGIGAGQLVLELLSVALVTRDCPGEHLRVIFRLVEVLRTARLLAAIITMLRVERSHHLINH